MADWFRSISVLGIAFASVVALTFGLAAIIVPRAAGSAQDPNASSPNPSGPVAVPGDSDVTTIGGTLEVSGARDALFVLDHEELGSRYAITGPDGRVIFEGNPLTVAQISFDGLEFFLDPDECSVTPGERHDETGVAAAHLACEEIADVRDQGVVTVDGVIGVAADLVGLRGDLPVSGGTVKLGDETLTFDFAAMTIPSGAQFSGVFAGSLYDPETATMITFTYDPQNHEMVLSEVGYSMREPRQPARVPPDACSVNTTEIGLLNPHTRVVEMAIRCAAIEVVDLGTVTLDGTLIVELAEPPG
ncbi:MAG TPA: hypothetical protein VF365_08655 [Candidatus Limnocylindria bacterium]